MHRRTRPSRRAARLALALGLGLFTPAIVGAQGQTPTPIANPTAADLAAGAQVYTMYCARCHGLDGSGGMGPPAGTPQVAARRR